MPKRPATEAAAPRGRRATTKKPNAALYIGYAEDDEDIGAGRDLPSAPPHRAARGL